jgi:hypothetical protein
MYSLISTQGTSTYTRWDVRGGWNGWNGWNTLDGNYYSLYFSTIDKVGKFIHVYFAEYLILKTWKLLSDDRIKQIIETGRLTVKLVLFFRKSVLS